jgi:hypothetical protein
MPIRTKVCFSLLTTQSVIQTFPKVLTLLIVNVNNFSPTAYDTVFHAVGLDTISFKPTAAVTTVFDWPTLGSMIDSDQRLVTFLDNGANFESIPYLIDGTHISPELVIFLFKLIRLQNLQTFGRLPLMSPQVSIAL